ncbi:MAG: MAPEG family protein [Pseudomonadales bacterium]|nr:MAPEG family protein [Pseudomonadales bacterium]
MLQTLNPDPILLPVLALVLWTLFMQAWMILTRIPAMNKAKINPQAAQRTANLPGKIPDQIQWKADNYNHLMEHPTIFYATALVVAVAGIGSGLNLILAWAYVGIRLAHSLVQVTFNRVMVRFGLFVISSIVLLVLVVNSAIQLI